MDLTGLNKIKGSVTITANHASSNGQNALQSSDSVTNNFACPSGFVAVPPLSGYASLSFCVAKYEMKDDGSGNAISKAQGFPIINVTKSEATTKCTDIDSNYDLIGNDEWQAIARNIESVTSNWSGGKVGSTGGLNRGHTDSGPYKKLEASLFDSQACFKTGQTCSGTTWHVQRRTHVLSNGEIIWDLGGNVREWVKETNYSKFGANDNIAQITTSTHTSNQLFCYRYTNKDIDIWKEQECKRAFWP